MERLHIVSACGAFSGVTFCSNWWNCMPIVWAVPLLPGLVRNIENKHNRSAVCSDLPDNGFVASGNAATFLFDFVSAFLVGKE